jgi:Family of unknown function (DUF6252)
MKTQNTKTVRLAFIMLVTIAIFSCSKNDDAPVPIVQESIADFEGIKWSISNDSKIGKNASADRVIEDPAYTDAGFIYIKTQADDNSKLKIIIPKSQTVVGTYPLTFLVASPASTIVEYESATQKIYKIQSGFVKITEISDGRIKGTFTFKAVYVLDFNDKIEVTNGVFNLVVGNIA